jgi:uncharacterized protein (DUF488 family)
MKTSFFKLSGSDPKVVSIARYPPWRGPLAFKGWRYMALAPSKDLLNAWNEKSISEAEYIWRYNAETLSGLDPAQVYQELGNNAILLCYEAPGEFCYRRLIAGWFEEHLGVSVPEGV